MTTSNASISNISEYPVPNINIVEDKNHFSVFKHIHGIAQDENSRAEKKVHKESNSPKTKVKSKIAPLKVQNPKPKIK